MSDRVERLRARMAEMGLEAFLVSTPENRRYLSGFTGSAGYLFISHKDAVLATDFRYVEQAGRQAPVFRVERIGGELDWLPRLASQVGAERIGFESTHVTVAQHTAFAKALEADSSQRPALVATQGVVERLRAVKDPEELDLIQRAVTLADEAMERVSADLRPGVAEREVAWEMERAMRELGAEGASFDIIVAGGPNAALPHHRASDRPLQAGEPIVIDMGARYQGYCSDLTRTLYLDAPWDETFRKVYQTVLEAQEAAVAGVRSGMTGGEADALARQAIQEAGYGDAFGHSLGHGVGLAVHEYPRLAAQASDTLEDGMVFTIEPGIYLSGWGGVRIEDMVVLEGGVARNLTRASKAMVPIA